MEKNKTINLDDFYQFQNKLSQENDFKISQNALVMNNLINLVTNQTTLKKHPFEFNSEFKTPTSKITNQQNTGRCWLYATLNMIREKFIKDYDLENFEFSQSYLHLFDKLEKANVFLNLMLSLINTNNQDRLMYHLLDDPVSDGGYFEWSKNLILKYGLIPKSEYEDTFNSNNTYTINKLINIKLKQALIAFKANKNDDNSLNKIKNDTLKKIYEILIAIYGLIPKQFDLNLKNKKNKNISFTNLTPLTFLKKINFDFNQFISIVHTPYQKIKPFKIYELLYSSNVFENGNLKFLTVDLFTFKLLVISNLIYKQPIWFGADVDHFFNINKGVWALDLYDFDHFFNLNFERNISNHISNYHVNTNHAMVLNGYDVNHKKWNQIKKQFFNKKQKDYSLNQLINLISSYPINRFSLENSWGEKKGNKGNFVIANDWFDNYVYEIVVNLKTIKDFLKNPKILTKTEYANFKVKGKTNKANYFLNELILKHLDQKPIKIDLWDPFNYFCKKGVKYE